MKSAGVNILILPLHFTVGCKSVSIHFFAFGSRYARKDREKGPGTWADRRKSAAAAVSNKLLAAFL